MKSEFFCHVVDGAIQAYNLPRPKSWGNTAFGENASDAEYLAHGLYPIVGVAPVYDALIDRMDGPVYVVGEGVVIRTYVTVPLTADELAAIDNTAWEAIKAERDRRTQEGGYYVAPHWYHSDQFSRIQQIGLVMLGVNIPVGTMWKTLDNGLIEMTQALASQIFSAAAASDIAIFAIAEQHKSAMEAVADPSTYDHLVGWPLAYGEVP